MPARLNLTGRKFGRLVVLSDAGNNRHGQSRWSCRCDCGNELTTTGGYLANGDTRSCGCLHDDVAGARYRGKSTGPSRHRKDLTGQRFGLLTVTGYSHTVQKNHAYVAYWHCRCDCGDAYVANGHWIRVGKVVSCGCERFSGNGTRTHGASDTSEYRIWGQMITRCTNPNVAHFKDYGGRGITVCDRWRTSFENFYADMGPRPSPGHSVDRRNNDRGYSPDNCRWATQEEQCGNKRNNVMLTFNGQTHCLSKWSRLLGFKSGTMHVRRRRDIMRRAAEGTDPSAKVKFEKMVRAAPCARCYWCGKRVSKRRRHIDHIVPLVKGGSDGVHNLCLSCENCNHRKNAKLPEVFSGQFELFSGTVTC